MFLLVTSLVQEGGPQASLRQVWVGFVSNEAVGNGQWRAGLKVVPLEERAGMGGRQPGLGRQTGCLRETGVGWGPDWHIVGQSGPWTARAYGKPTACRAMAEEGRLRRHCESRHSLL